MSGETVGEFFSEAAQLINPINLVRVLTGATKGAVNVVDKIVNPDVQEQETKQTKVTKQIQNDVHERRNAKQQRLLDTNTIRPFIRESQGREYKDSKLVTIEKQKTTKQLLAEQNELLRQNILYSDVQAMPNSNQYFGNINMLTTGRKMAKVPEINPKSKDKEIQEARKAQVGMKTNTAYD